MKKIIGYRKPKNFWVKKVTQQGGSTWALQNALSNRDVLNIFITDTSDLQIRQVENRLLESGVNPNEILIKEDIKKVNLKDDYIWDKIIIVNKHPTYADRLATIINIANHHYNGVDMYWDECDYDSPYYEYPDPNSKKDLILTTLAENCRNIYQITASQYGLAISKSIYNGGAIVLPPYRNSMGESPDNTFLYFEDLTHVPVAAENLEAFLSGEDYPAKDIENFIKLNEDEGILVRAEYEIEAMEGIKDTLLDKGYKKVHMLNGAEYVDPRKVTGILVSYKMALRGVTFPNMHHMIVKLPRDPSFADCIQLLRILGWGKKLKNNYIMCTHEDWGTIQRAHRAEKIARKALEDFPTDWKGRYEYLKRQLWPHGKPLPRNKMDGWRRITSTHEFERVGNKVPYTPESAEFYTKYSAVPLVERLTDATGVLKDTQAKWGKRPFHKVVNDLINNSPASAARLDRSDIQRVEDGIAIERLYPKEELIKLDLLAGLVYIDKEYYIQTWKRIPKAKYTRIEK